MAAVAVLAFFSGFFGAIYNYIQYAGWKKKSVRKGYPLRVLSENKNERLYEIFIYGEDEPYRCIEKLGSAPCSSVSLDRDSDWYVNPSTRTVSNDGILENYRHTIKNDILIAAVSAVILPVLFILM